MSFKARLYGDGLGKYFMDLVNVRDPRQPKATYEVELSRGGGLYKQRWMAKLPDGSRCVLPVQCHTGAPWQSNPYLRGAIRGRLGANQRPRRARGGFR